MLSQSDTFAGDDPTSIILKDPYPEHTRNGLSRAASSVLKLYSSRSLPKQVAEIMASSLFAGLEVLRQISYSASESLHDLYMEYSKFDLVIRRRQPVPATNLTVVPSAYEAALTPELFEEATFKQLDLAGEDPFLVNKTIGRHETHEIPDDFAWFDLDGADLTFMNQDWSFQVGVAQKASRIDMANFESRTVSRTNEPTRSPFNLRRVLSNFPIDQDRYLQSRGLGSEPRCWWNFCQAIGSQPRAELQGEGGYSGN